MALGGRDGAAARCAGLWECGRNLAGVSGVSGRAVHAAVVRREGERVPEAAPGHVGQFHQCGRSPARQMWPAVSAQDLIALSFSVEQSTRRGRSLLARKYPTLPYSRGRIP